MTLELWHKIFGLTRLDWVPPISIIDMLTISFKSLSIIIRDKVLWQIVCLTLIWIVWQKINKRISMEKLRTSEMVSNLFLFLFLELHYRRFLRAYLGFYTTILYFDMQIERVKIASRRAMIRDLCVGVAQNPKECKVIFFTLSPIATLMSTRVGFSTTIFHNRRRICHLSLVLLYILMNMFCFS